MLYNIGLAIRKKRKKIRGFFFLRNMLFIKVGRYVLGKGREGKGRKEKTRQSGCSTFPLPPKFCTATFYVFTSSKSKHFQISLTIIHSSFFWENNADAN